MKKLVHNPFLNMLFKKGVQRKNHRRKDRVETQLNRRSPRTIHLDIRIQQDQGKFEEEEEGEIEENSEYYDEEPENQAPDNEVFDYLRKITKPHI